MVAKQPATTQHSASFASVTLQSRMICFRETSHISMRADIIGWLSMLAHTNSAKCHVSYDCHTVMHKIIAQYIG